MTIRGSCLCGEVTYEISGEFISAMNCHCSRCRRAHGAAFASYAEINAEQFCWLSGKELIKSFGDGKGAYCFCANCGSNVVATWEGEVVEVALGPLEDDPGIHPGYHQHVGSKAAWHEISDDKPQYEEGCPAAAEEDS